MSDNLARDAERVVLGAMMLDPDVILPVVEAVRSSDFADARHASVFAAITANHAAGAETGPVGVAIALNAVKELHRVGGATYLHDLIAAVPTSASATWYARQVADAARVRQAVADAARLTQIAESGDLDAIADEQGRLSAVWTDRAAVDVGNSWHRVNLDAVLDGTYDPPMPTVGRRDGLPFGLFYPGRVHTIAGESESAKTWVAVCAALAELAAGNGVAYIDFEDDEGGVVGRMLALGAKPDAIRDRFGYVRPIDSLTVRGNRAALDQVLGDLRPTLAVLDGITEAMTLEGLEIKDNGHIAKFGALLPRWIAARGPATVALDHVVKDREGRGRYAIGGVHKLNGVNGAAYVLESRVPFAIGATGRTSVHISKDRPGQLRRHAVRAGDGLHWLADLVMTSHDATFVEAELVRPADVGPFRPTVLMGRVAEALTRAGEPLAKQDIEARVTGRAADIRTALAALIDDGYVTVTTGRYNAKLHSLIKPYGDHNG